MNTNYDYRVLITSVGGYLGYQNIEYILKNHLKIKFGYYLQM